MISTRTVGAGAFVIVGSLLFALALFTIGERRMLFEERFPVYAEFTKLGQLEPGAIVRVAGMEAGEVADIEIPASPAGRFRIRMDIREALHGLVRTDSIAAAQSDGLVGAVFMSIQPGTEGAPKVASGGTIRSREPISMADVMDQASVTVKMLGDTIQGLRGDIETTVRAVALTAQDAHGLLADIRPDLTTMARNGTAASGELTQVLTDLRSGKGTIGQLINDPGLYNRVNHVADEAQTVMTNMKAMSTEARQAITDLRANSSPAQGLVADMRVTVGQARDAVADLADNMEALKRNFLLRGFFNKRGYFSLDDMAPAEYRKGLLEKGNRKPMRTWLLASALFESMPDGKEGLSPKGKAELDSAVAGFLPYLPASPLVIEGYATGGSLAEQFTQARHRAHLVREYLIGKYSLSAAATGSIALGSEAISGPNGKTWDGIAVTLFADPVTRQAATAARVNDAAGVPPPAGTGGTPFGSTQP